MPQVEGVFRQRRQTYSSNSIVRLYDPLETASTSFCRFTNRNTREFCEMLKHERKINGRLSRRKKRRLLRSLQNSCGDQSTSQFLCETTKRKNRKRSKSLQSPSVMIFKSCSADTRSDFDRNNTFTSTDEMQSFSVETNTPIGVDCFTASCSDLFPISAKENTTQIETNLWQKISQNIQTVNCNKNVSVMAIVSKRDIAEKQIQKSEKMIVKSMRDEGTEMVEHFTLSDLYCIEWMHRNLLEVNLNPYVVVADEKIKTASEMTCYTSKYS